MDFNIPPVNPSGFHPVNQPQEPSNGSYPPNQRALYDAYEAFYAELQTALKDGPNADLTKLKEAAARLQQLIVADTHFFPSDANSDLYRDLMGLGDKQGKFKELLFDCANGRTNKIKVDFNAILNSPNIQNQIQNSFNALNQTFPPPSSKYNATEQLFLDQIALLQQIFSTDPQPNPNDPLLAVFCQNIQQLQNELKASGDNMYNAFENKAPSLLINLIQDAYSPLISRDIGAIEANWVSVSAGIQAFLNDPTGV